MLKSKNKLLHKALAFVLTFSLLATLVSFNFTANATEINGGAGTISDPYLISDEAELTAYAELFAHGNELYYAKLDNNITVNTNWTAINKFSGTLDGDGHTISFNCGISSASNGLYGFCGINEGTITNLIIEGNVTVSGEKDFVGSIAGLNRGSISNCTNKMSITASGKNTYAGGIVGVMDSGTISNCKNEETISVTTATDSTDITDKESSSGGIVALNYNGTVEKCTNIGSVSNTDNGYTGGIVGCNNGTVDNCLNTTVDNATGSASNSNSTYVGSIVGLLYTNPETGSTATLTNSLNTTNSGNVVGSNGIGENGSGTIDNCYYLANSDNDTIDNTTNVTQDELNNGSVTYKLNNGNVSNPVWGQTIPETESDYQLPVIGITTNDDGTSNIVYKGTEGDNSYTNTKPTCGNNHKYENGVCTVCGDVLIKVSNYSLTIDGSIGLNYYISVDKNSYNENTLPVTFIANGTDTKEFTAEKTTVDGTPEKFNIYKATVLLKSDQMNYDIVVKASVNNNQYESKPFSVNAYLLKLNSNPAQYDSNNAEELKNLAINMYTYGYYANEYFGNNASYSPTIALNNDITLSSGISDNYNLSYTDNVTADNTLTHYASSLQHLEQIKAFFYVQGVDEQADNTYMKYETVSTDGNNTSTNNNAKYVKVEPRNGYYYGLTDMIPIAQLGTTKFAVTFGTGSGDSFVASSKTKYYGPYTYIKNIFQKYENDNPNDPSYKLIQALYHYSEAAKVYFDAVAATE